MLLVNFVCLWMFQTAPVSLPASGDINVLFSQLTWGAAFAYLLLLAQKWEKLPWVTQHTAGISAVVRAVLAGIATIGISVSWNGAAHSLTISNLSFPVIASGLWHWFGQYALQHGWGQLFLVKTNQQQ
jgi:hypothetical protein